MHNFKCLFTGDHDAVMTNNFTALGSEFEGIVWSDTDDHITSNDTTDDKLWSDDDTVVDDCTLVWDDDIITHSMDTTAVMNTSLPNPSLWTSISDSVLLQREASIPLTDNILTNQMLENTKSINKITANEGPPNIPLTSNTSSDTVIPIEAPPV